MPNLEGPTSADPDSRLERLAAWAVPGLVAWVLGAACVVQVATWAPNYLTWPWWADHDVFATAARGWDEGTAPYRDLKGNNFPGTTYVFWVLGKVFGWGHTPSFWAFDVALLAAFGAVLWAWSRRSFGTTLPGWAGWATAIGYVLNLDYSQAAQRDGQAPLFAIAAVLVAQAWPSRGGRWASGLLWAVGLTFRPQVALFGPALLLAVIISNRSVRAVFEWGLAVAIGLALGSSPLVACALFDDFLDGLRLVSFGGRYNSVTPTGFVKEFLAQFLNLKLLVTIVGLILLFDRARPSTRRIAATWLAGLACVALYRPSSPIPHAYLTHPLMLTWAISVGVLVAVVLEAGWGSAALRLTAVLLVLALGVTAKPRFSNPVGSWEAFGWLRRGTDPESPPTGYTTNAESPSAGRYEWEDYRRLLDYLRRELDPKLKVANALRHVPAVTGPTGRTPAFPAESVAWIRVVNSRDEQEFVGALEGTPDSVVVWDPSNPEPWRFPRPKLLHAAIEERYEPAKKFGLIEVWRRKDASAKEVHVR